MTCAENLPAEMYRGKGAVVNLWNLQRRVSTDCGMLHYAELVRPRLAIGGIAAVDDLHKEFRLWGPDIQRS